MIFDDIFRMHNTVSRRKKKKEKEEKKMKKYCQHTPIGSTQ
jgi:hypothetical protein